MNTPLSKKEAQAFAAWAHEAGPALRGRQPAQWLNQLEAQHTHLNAVLDWCIRHDVVLGVVIAGQIWPFWLNRGYLVEGVDWLNRLIESPHPQPNALSRARALAGAGNLAFHQGKFEASATWLRESLAIAEIYNDAQGIAEAHGGLSRIAMSKNNAAAMRQHSQIALEAARQADYETGIAIALHHLAHAALIDGDLASAERLYGDNVVTYRAMQRADLVASELHNLGHVACLRGHNYHAKSLFIESLAVIERIGGSPIRPYNYIGLGRVAAALAQPRQATILMSAGLSILHNEGKAIVPLLRGDVERTLASLQTALSPEAYANAEAEGRKLDTVAVLTLAAQL